MNASGTQARSNPGERRQHGERNREKRPHGGAIAAIGLPRPIDKSPTPSYLSTACRSARRGIRDRGLTNARKAPSFKCLDDDCRSSVYWLGDTPPADEKGTPACSAP